MNQIENFSEYGDKNNTMEVCESGEQESEEHEYVEIIGRPQVETSPISSRLYYHLDTISNKITITSKKLKFAVCFILGCLTAVCIVTPVMILIHRPAADTFHQYGTLIYV